MVMDLIRLDTEPHLVRLNCSRRRDNHVLTYLFVADQRGSSSGTRSPACRGPPKQYNSKRRDAVRRAPEAMLDSDVQPLGEDGNHILCFKDTRAATLDKLMRCVNGPSSPPIFWLHGLAGTGKSAIARTVGTRANETGSTTASCRETGSGRGETNR